jgi:hypothetical protein
MEVRNLSSALRRDKISTVQYSTIQQTRLGSEANQPGPDQIRLDQTGPDHPGGVGGGTMSVYFLTCARESLMDLMVVAYASCVRGFLRIADPATNMSAPAWHDDKRER